MIRHVVVVVPAHDEAESIGACLRSLHHACGQLAATVSTTIVVVADACRDGSADVARAMARSGDLVIEAGHRCAGAARRLGVSAALLEAGTPPTDIWIASTDADTIVPPSWLTAQLTIAEAGVVGVAGTVRIDGEAAGWPLATRFADSYTVAMDGTHPHVHGANLGVRGDAYLACGGWSPLPTAEDHDLWNRVRRQGRTLTTTTTCVTTSHRTIGRAPAGFADNLALLAESVA